MLVMSESGREEWELQAGWRSGGNESHSPLPNVWEMTDTRAQISSTVVAS
jgi:hypothetical protein